MTTKVTQTYTAGYNVSVTLRHGAIAKVTLWVTGNDASKTERITPESE